MDLTGGSESPVWSSHISRHITDTILGFIVIVLLIQAARYLLRSDYPRYNTYTEPPKQETIVELKEKLRNALAVENYEEAGKLRDKIEKLKLQKKK